MRLLPVVVVAVLALRSQGAAVQDAGARAADRLRTLREEAEGLAKREKSLLIDLRRLELERDIRLQEQRDTEKTLATANEELSATMTQLEALEQRQAAQVPGLAARLAELYKLGSGGYVRMLFSVDDVREMGRAYRAVASLAARDRERIRAHASTLESLRKAKADLRSRRERSAKAEADARRATAEAAAAIQARSALISEIDARRDLNAQLAGELQSAQQKLSATVAALPSGAGTDLPIRPFQGALEWPVTGRVISPFGRSSMSRFGTAVTRNGIEIASPLRRTVAVVHEGRVAYAAPFTGYGNLVIVDHGAQIYTLYGYLSTIAVNKGDRVEKGGRVGEVGVSPTGQAVLYFEVRVDGKPVDPLQWLKSRF
jgi:septal ring factor EnvC (AmiA/AmiB activator)